MTVPKDYRFRPCRSCGRTTTRAQCLDCRLIGHPATYSPDHALTGGQWVPGKHGVQVWVSNGAPPSTDDDPHPEAACTTCGVQAHQACRNAAGRSVAPHAGRIIPRQCKCGGVPTRCAPTCQDCQDKRKAEGEQRRARREAERACTEGHAQARNDRGELLACKTCARDRDRQRVAQRRQAKRQDAA